MSSVSHLCLALIAVCALPARALDPNRVESQYVHDTLAGDKGLEGEVHAITQTSDGYLWIGSDAGLFRFDGLDFRRMLDRSPSPVTIVNVMGLALDAQGKLMVRLPERNLLRYADGKFDNALYPLVPRELAVTAMCRGNDGNLYLAGLIHGILRYVDGRFETVAPVTALPASPIISIAQSADGKIWLGTRESGLFYLEGKRITAVRGQLPSPKVDALLADGGRVWIGTDGGLAQWNGAALTDETVPASLKRSHVLAILADHQSNLWVGTTTGLFRVNGKIAAPFNSPERGSDAVVNSLFEDREGTLWVGGKWGIERWRDGNFMTYGQPEGLPSDHNGPIYADADDRTWFAPLEGGLYWLGGGHVTRVTQAGLPADVVYSIAGSNGDLWLGRQRGGLTHLYMKDGALTSKTFTQADGLAQNSVFSVYRSRDGTVWAGTLNRGISRYRDGRFTTYAAGDGLASNTVTSILEGSDGTMWFGTPNGLRAFANDRWRAYTAKEGLASDQVNCLMQDSSGILWIGTAAGLSFLSNGDLRTPGNAPALHEPVFGIAQDKNGWLWISTSDHVVRINRDTLLRGAIAEGDMLDYIAADGLRSTHGIWRDRSVVVDHLGRIWFSMAAGLSVVNPAQLTNGSVPAFVHVEGISADNGAIDPHGAVRIPPGTRRITFSFSGGSLGDPTRLLFRYQLAGYDPGWSAPTTARETSYTSVGPGSYRFLVSALNTSGKWNETGAYLDFSVAPRYYQTAWFQLSSLAAGLALLAALYRLRLRQVARQFNIRMEERVHERTRIARELHDTLLQSFNGVVLKFSAVKYMMRERPAEADGMLEKAIEEARHAIIEGRDAVQGLRSSTVLTNDLARAITTFGEGLAPDQAGQSSPHFGVRVEGKSVDLAPLVRDEVYRIAGEALRNAFRHSAARRIEVEIHYEKRQLRMRLRDDGKGIDPQTLKDGGRTGHHGLPGMRERAEVVGGKLSVWSEINSGTEIELSIPAALAYAKASQPTTE